MIDLPILARKLNAAVAGERGIRLSAEELDLFVAVGGNDVVQRAAADRSSDWTNGVSRRIGMSVSPKISLVVW